MFFTKYLFFIQIFFLLSLIKSIKKTHKKRNLEELSNDIVILHLNDVHCGINQTIGYDGFVLFRNELKKKYNNIITVDVGDHIQGSSIGAISDGTAIIDIINKIGFDVAILGNHEFDYGIAQLLKLDTQISRYICSNFCFKEDKTLLFPPYKIIEIGGKKIGFIGVLTPLTFTKTYLSTIKDSNGEKLYDFLPQDYHTKTQDYINELRNIENVDYVILLTHMGMTLEEYTSDDLLLKLENVDAILDAHTHKIYNTTSKDKNGNDVYVAQTGTKLESIGMLILKEDHTITTEIIKEVPEPNDKTNVIKINRNGKERWVDKEMNDFINAKWSEYDGVLNRIVGYSNYDLIIKPEESSDSHHIYCRVKECTVGNLIADAIKSEGKGEISIINGGSIRSNMYKGTLTRSKLIDIVPWFNTVIEKTLTGQTILDVLEFGVSKYPNPSGGFLQVSGITYDIKPNIKSSVLIDEYGEFIKVDGERRVSNVKINGKEIDLNKLYKTSLVDYIGNGGDGYSMLADKEISGEIPLSDSDAFSYYIMNTLNGTIPEKYKDFQGRINFISSSDTKDNNSRNLLSIRGGILTIIIPFLASLFL